MISQSVLGVLYKPARGQDEAEKSLEGFLMLDFLENKKRGSVNHSSFFEFFRTLSQFLAPNILLY